MLWQKESSNRNALYVDILNRDEMNIIYMRLNSDCTNSSLDKNDAIALRKRKEGNTYFDRRQWIEAMELYNESLCFATEGSEHVGLAYSNRSACFFNMKMYKECMVDIELATKAGCPDNVMPKLVRRKAECLRLICDGAEAVGVDLRLSFEPHDKFPCMANVLEFEKGKDGDFWIVAKEDIDIGKTIVVDQAFNATQNQRFGLACNICLKKNANLTPCSKCSIAMFCEKCQNNSLHKDECGLKITDDYSINGMIMSFVRTILKIMSTFSNVDELMNFVEQTMKSDPKEIPETLSDERSKYKAFLKLPVCKDSDHNIYSVFVHPAYKTIFNIPKLKNLFRSMKHRRFLAHLLYHHAMILENNTIGNRSSWHNFLATPFCDDYISCSILLMTNWFQQSCAPNVLAIDCFNSTVYISVRTIKRGEQLTQSPFGFLFESYESRKKIMLEHQNRICKCSRCEGVTASQEQRQRLASDPDYRYIASKNSALKMSEGKAVQAMVDKCHTFLKRYIDVEWCHEIAIAVDAYARIVRQRFPPN